MVSLYRYIIICIISLEHHFLSNLSHLSESVSWFQYPPVIRVLTGLAINIQKISTLMMVTRIATLLSLIAVCTAVNVEFEAEDFERFTQYEGLSIKA